MQGDTDIIAAEEMSTRKMAAALAASSNRDLSEPQYQQPSWQANKAVSSNGSRSSKPVDDKLDLSHESSDDEQHYHDARSRALTPNTRGRPAVNTTSSLTTQNEPAYYSDEYSDDGDNHVEVQMRVRMGSQGQGMPQTMQLAIDDNGTRSQARSGSRSRMRSPKPHIKASISSSPTSPRKAIDNRLPEASVAWWDQQDSTSELTLLINSHEESILDDGPTTSLKFSRSKPQTASPHKQDFVHYDSDRVARRQLHSEASEDPQLMTAQTNRRQKAIDRAVPSPDEVAIMMVPESPKSKRRSLSAVAASDKVSSASASGPKEDSTKIYPRQQTDFNDQGQVYERRTSKGQRTIDSPSHLSERQYASRHANDSDLPAPVEHSQLLHLPPAPTLASSDMPATAREAQWRARERAYSLLVQQLTKSSRDAERARDALRADILSAASTHQIALDTANLERQKVQDELELERATSVRWRKQSRALAHALDVARAERELLEAKLRTSSYEETSVHRSGRYEVTHDDEPQHAHAMRIDTSLATRSPRQTRKQTAHYHDEDSVYRVEIARSSSPARALRENAI